MDYRRMAEELLAIRAAQLKVPASQQMARLVKGEWFVLNYLATSDHFAYPKELSEKMAVSTARIAVILKQMERKKWITKTTDPKDNRQVLVALTEEGQRVIREKRREAIDVVAQMLEKLGSEDAPEFLRIQQRIIREQ